ncbi:hypothetical protein [Candidatus Electrothrix sp.]|uniref:hypothetical protein n=1 Tax=Candidatus Electrothrix sp. TaxID=2170559 RepID=UPI004056C9B0
MSYGQLGIGNPGSYGGKNDDNKLYDDLEGKLCYEENPYRVAPEELLGMLPIGGVGSRFGQLGKKLIGKPYPTKPGYMGRPQPYNPSNGRYLPHNANPGPQLSPLARFGAGVGQGWAEAKTGAQGATPVGKAGNLGHIVGNILGNIF